MPAVAVVVWSYRTVPLRNSTDPQIEVLLVLGSPTELDGSVTAEQRWRVGEAVREYRAGRAAHILLSGGAVANHFVEAHTMAVYAARLGVPPGALLEEGTSRNTLENVRNSETMLRAHGWSRVEVISTADHLPRAALLLAHTGLQWQMHAAPTPDRTWLQTALGYGEEALATALIRGFGLRLLPLLHGIAVVQHTIAFGVRWMVYTVEGWFRR